jgi:hypothetical protein
MGYFASLIHFVHVGTPFAESYNRYVKLWVFAEQFPLYHGFAKKKQDDFEIERRETGSGHTAAFNGIILKGNWEQTGEFYEQRYDIKKDDNGNRRRPIWDGSRDFRCRSGDKGQAY